MVHATVVAISLQLSSQLVVGNPAWIKYMQTEPFCIEVVWQMQSIIIRTSKRDLISIYQTYKLILLLNLHALLLWNW